jgi:hypothetical protein
VAVGTQRPATPVPATSTTGYLTVTFTVEFNWYHVFIKSDGDTRTGYPNPTDLAAWAPTTSGTHRDPFTPVLTPGSC